MGYLSFQIIFFLLLAAVLGFVIGWLLRGSRFQSELQDLDGRWRTKLGEVEGERDRFVTELTHANESKVKAEAELKRLSETQANDLQTLKRDYQTKLAAFADAEKTTAGLKSDLATRNEKLSKAQADLAKAQQSGGDASRLGKELTAASERAATLESSLKDARTAQTNCRREVDRLQAEIAELRRSSGGAATGSASSGGALGLMSGGGSATVAGGAGAGSAGGSTGSAGQASSGSAGGSTGGIGSGSGIGGSPGGSGQAGSGSAGGSTGGTGSGSSAGGSPGGSGQASSGSAGGATNYTQRAPSPSYLADTGGQGYSGRDAQSAGTSSGGSGAESGDDEGVRPAALSAARDGRADDLKRISGVGPKLEKTLNGLGIFHFAQIAEFTPDNVAWVDRHLRFKGRIARENWIKQAKILTAGGETEFSRRQ